MPRYFFHLRSPSGRLIRDDEGVELADLDAAAQEAALAAADLGRDCELGGRIIPAGTSRCGATAARLTRLLS
jgi:hypothetical protein